MSESILLVRGRTLIRVPRNEWEKHVHQAPAHHAARHSFMTADHQHVRYCVVRALAATGQPISVAAIAAALTLAPSRVEGILADLERNLLFLVRNEKGEVAWAFPVTAERTPHRITFDDGEVIYGAGAEDAMATPFVQGHLQNRVAWARIETACAHCGQSLHIQLDSEMRYHVEEADAQPLVFEPNVDFKMLTDPNIIHAYGMNSVFFWSEEHARAHFDKLSVLDNHRGGVLLTLAQSAYSTPIVQGALFGWVR